MAGGGPEGRRKKLPRVQPRAPARASASKEEQALEDEALASSAVGPTGDGEKGEAEHLQDKDDGNEDADGAEEPATDARSRIPVARAPEALFQTGSTFAKLGLARWLVEGCGKLGMTYPTEIQVMSIPPILAGKNVIGNSKTGSGKTACYCLPMLHHLSRDPFGIFALVLTPIRELAFQVSENFRALGAGIGVEVVEVVGGRDFTYQGRMIAERKHIIVATPGRLADLLRGDPGLAQAFRNLRIFVMDEADKLLTQSFEETLPQVLSILPKTRQTLLFSATITKSIEKLRSRLSADGKELMVLDANPRDETLDNLTQQYVFVPKTIHICYLHYLLKEHFSNDSCMVFAPTIELCQLFATMLEILGFPVSGLHSLQSQMRRQACLQKFRAGRSTILVATDVAARGLDIPKVSVVINIGLPLNTDDYVHRAGRTARAGRPGLVVSLMTERDVNRVGPIEKRIGKELELRKTDEEEAIKLMSKTAKAQQKAELLLSELGFEDRMDDYKAKKSEDKKKSKAKREREASAQAAAPDATEDTLADPPVERPSKKVKRKKGRAKGGADAGAG